MATRGKVKWFSESRGYGFIEKEDGGEIFAHFSETAGADHKILSERDKITFDSLTGLGGPKEAHVVMLVMAPSKTLQPV
jgi:CspA family cold shock protein